MPPAQVPFILSSVPLSKKITFASSPEERASFPAVPAKIVKRFKFHGKKYYAEYIAKIMLESPNFLLMDEPTNHLDLESITALNKGMINYKGCMLFASHDQEIVETTANRIFDLVDENTFKDLQTVNFDD